MQVLDLTSSVPVAVSILTTRGHAHPPESRSHKTSRNRIVGVGVLRYCLAGMEEGIALRYTVLVLGLETTKGRGVRSGRR